MTDSMPHKPAPPPLPANEPERLAALHRYKILDTPPEAAFDRLTTLAARLFAVPTVLISLVDTSRAWFKSCIGFDAREVPRDDTFCSFAVLTDEPLIVPDAQLDDRFACNPFVQSEPGVRFYAGAPLLNRDGFNLGTLCLLDSQPRETLSAEQQATLVDLAAMVVDELELRSAAQKIAQVDTALLEITQGVATVTGDAYFDALVRHLAKVLNADYGYIGLIEGDEPNRRLRTIATCAHGEIVDNLEYLLQDTPCWEVIEQRKICCYPRNVQAHFPNAPLLKPLSVESYVAIPFFDSSGTVLGLLGVMDGKPLEHVQLAESLLTVFALRIATELERQQTEAALYQSEAKYRTLFESIDEGFCICELLFDENGAPIDYRFLEVNSVFGKLTGLEQAKGKTIRALIPDLEASWIEAYGRVVQTGESVRFVEQSTAMNRWFDVNAFRVGEPSSNQFAVLFTNITDRKRVEVALQEREAQIRSILESITDGFFALDPDWRFTYVNPQAERILDQAPGELLGKVIWEAYPGAVGTEFERAYRHTASERVASSFVSFYPDHNRWYEAYAYPAAIGITVYFRDVTEKMQAESVLRESEEKTRNILESINDAFVAVDQHWQFTYVNSTAETLLGYTSGDWAGKVLWEEFPGLEENELAQLHRRVMRDRVAESLTAFYPDHDRWYEARSYPAANGITIYFTDVSEQIQAEAALRQSEERYRTLFESIDEGFCVVEILLDAHDTPIDYRILEVNPIFEQQSGLQEAIGKTARQLNFEEHWIEIYGRVALTGESIRFENSAATLNRWFDVYACRTGEPEERKVAIVFKDISDRKRVEKIARRTAEANAFRVSLTDALRPLVDPIEVQAVASRVLGEYLGANRVAYFEVHNADYVVERAYVNGAVGIAGRHPIDSFGSTLLAAFRTGRPVAVSDVQADPNLLPEQRAAYAAIETRAHIGIPLVKEGTFVAGLAIHTSEARVWTTDEIALAEEVAERTWAAVERARAEAVVAADLQDTQRLRELGVQLVIEDDIQTLYQEIMAAAIALTRADAGTVQILDVATQDLVLLATQGFKQTTTIHFGRINERDHTPCGIALKTGNRSFVDFDVPESEYPDRARRLLVEAGYRSGQSTPLITRAGKIIGIVSTHWREHHRPSERELRFLDLLARQAADLIEQRQTAAEREQLLVLEQAARAEADRANRIKDEFLAVLSHELRSPLNPILGWTRLLQNGKLDAARQAEALKTIERNAKLQAQLIEDLLDISRIMQGKLSLTAAPVSLASVLSAALETVQLAAAAKHIQMTLDLEPNIALIAGDAARLQQVVWNLLTNAVKFTPVGGQVTIALRQVDQWAQMRVIDTGRGIQPQFLPHVFEYFRQEDGSTTRQFGGLGLGLAIVRQIVEMHGGTVWAESEGENQGASFTVQLPLSTQAQLSEPEPPRNSVTTEASLGNLQILLVDDEIDTREFQTIVLEQSGATVTAVASSLEALQALDQFVPDLLVSDIGMAEMDGYMLIEQIRSRRQDCGGAMPAIALTAYAGTLAQQRAIESGFQAHLTKPVEPEALVKAIVSLLRR
ncbi:MAG: GAF domain-containing protein [Stenomitos frigidus ULC029]